MTTSDTLRVAVAQFPASSEIPTAEVLADVAAGVRATIATAAEAGARLVQFPEGTLSYPHKRLISRSAPELDEADWTKVDWTALRSELEAIADAARRHSVWVVVGAPHWLGEGLRPHNSLYVFADDGSLVTRYDKRRLSTTETTYLYQPGVAPVIFEIDGFKVGMVLCLEALFPDLFVEYADSDTDLVLISSVGGGIFGQLALAYGAITSMSIALSLPPDDHEISPTGVCGPLGWIVTSETKTEELVLADVPRRKAPLFHYQARHGLYDAFLGDPLPRTLDRTSL